MTEIDNLLNRIMTVYQPPQHVDLKDKAQIAEVLQAYRAACKRYLPLSTADAEKIFSILASNRTFWAWPAPGEVAAAFAQLHREAHDNRIGE